MAATLTDLVIAAIGGGGVALAVAGFLGRSLVAHWLAKDLKTYDAGLAARVRVIELQLPAYRDLWQLSGVFRSSHRGPYDLAVMQRAERDIVSWYYRGGNGAMLSFDAQSILQAGLQLLRAGDPDDSAVITRVFSSLRTQLKSDLGIYSRPEARRELTVNEVIRTARDEVARVPAASGEGTPGA